MLTNICQKLTGRGRRHARGGKEDEQEKEVSCRAGPSKVIMSNGAELDPISELFRECYPSQRNVIQATSQLQYWQNGPDPLDYINIYINYDAKHTGLYPHYHYVSLGLSDLYGDQRVHKRSKPSKSSGDGAGDSANSGYGFEISIKIPVREKLKPGAATVGSQAAAAAPKWPLKLMQSLARYTFSTGCLLELGDHVPNVLTELLPGSRVKHLIVANDSCFPLPISTRFGMVKILQLVGCTDEELVCAQNWSARKLVEYFKRFKEFGHDYLLTDPERAKSILDMDKSLIDTFAESISHDGSFLSFVKSNSFWKLNQMTVEIPKTSMFNVYKEIRFFCDVDTARLMSSVFRGRLLRSNTFIFNGLDGHNLICIPEDFINKECHVNSKYPLRASKKECQLYLNKKLLASEILAFLDSIDTKKVEKSLMSIIRAEAMFFIDENKDYTLFLTVIENEKIVDYYENF